MTTPRQRRSVAIIGFGSRGLSILERLISLSISHPRVELRVHIIDPACSGEGLHSTTQPEYLLLNTTCGQVSMFPDEHTLGQLPSLDGPSLYDWAAARGLRMGSDGFTVSTQGRALRPTDFLPRRVLGEYLRWFADHLTTRLPESLTLIQHRAEAVDIDEAKRSVVLSNGDVVMADDVFLTVGHASSSRGRGAPGAARLIENPSPLPSSLEAVLPGETIAVRGFGLTAMDVVSALTHGRGGRYEQDGDGIAPRYLPSGSEPRILMYSRSGLPFRARPSVCSFDHVRKARVFTRARCAELRNREDARTVDFEQHVLPLILTEMRLAYRECEVDQEGPAARQAFEQRLRTHGLERTLDELDNTHGSFDPAALLAPEYAEGLEDSNEYQRAVLQRVRADLTQAALGPASSPTKASLDVLREGRDAFRDAVDFDGLSRTSRELFYRETVPVLNRAVVGPQFERHQELLALVDAGVLSVPLGPAPRVVWEDTTQRWMMESTRLRSAITLQADWLCFAAVPATPAAGTHASPLVRNMFERGTLRPCAPAGGHVPGAEVGPGHHPIGRDGRERRRIWVLGPLCEGSIFYNHLVPSPRVWSRPVFEANHCVMDFFSA